MKNLCRFSVLFLGFCISSALAVAQTFSVTDLGSLSPGGVIDVSYGDAINNLGQVVGSSYTPALTLHAFYWTNTSGITDLGTFGGPGSIAWGINDLQQVVGQADLSNGDTHAFLWTATQGMRDLGTLGGSCSFAYAINVSGQIVGQSCNAQNGSTHAFLWTQAGGMQDLGTLGGSNSIAYAINDRGEVVGSSDITGNTGTHAFLWTKQHGMRDLGTLTPSSGSIALSINSLGQMVGYSGSFQQGQYNWGVGWTSPYSHHIFPFIAGSIENFPNAINDLSQVTGEFFDSQGDGYAFLYGVDIGMQNLNRLIPPSSGWTLTTGTAINIHGQITGWGVVQKKGLFPNHAYLLTQAP